MSSIFDRACFVTEMLSSKDPIVKDLLSQIERLHGAPISKILLDRYVMNNNFKNDPLDKINNNTNNGEKNMNKTEGNNNVDFRLTRIEDMIKSHVDNTFKHFEKLHSILKDVADILNEHEDRFENISKDNTGKSSGNIIEKEKLYLCWDECRKDAEILICHNSEFGEESFKSCNEDCDGYKYKNFDEIPKKYYDYSSDKPQTGKIYFVWDERKDDGMVMFCQGRFNGEYSFCSARSEINDTDICFTYKHIEPIRTNLIGKVSK